LLLLFLLLILLYYHHHRFIFVCLMVLLSELFLININKLLQFLLCDGVNIFTAPPPPATECC